MSNLIVVPNEVDGWDIVRSDDPQALTNTPTLRYWGCCSRLR